MAMLFRLLLTDVDGDAFIRSLQRTHLMDEYKRTDYHERILS